MSSSATCAGRGPAASRSRPVGAVASFDEGSGKFTIYVNSVDVQLYRLHHRSRAQGREPSGQSSSRSMPAAASAASCSCTRWPCWRGRGARMAGRPVKYIEDRIDNITACDNHGSDRTYDVELALDADHRMTALRYKVVDDYGAYFQFGLGTHGNGFSQTVGPYKIRAVGAEDLRRLHQQVPAGRLPRLWLRSHELHDRAASSTPRSRSSISTRSSSGTTISSGRRNFPYQIPTGNLYDSGNYPGALDMALQMLDYDGWRDKQQAGIGRKGAMSASASRAARRRVCSAPPNSGCSTARRDLR